MTKYLLVLFIAVLQYTTTKASIVVLNGLSHQHSTEKGKVYKGVVEIQNNGKTKKNVKLYLQDLSYQADGTIAYTEPGTNNLTNTDWIKMSTNLLELQPGEKKEILYEITMPNHINAPGSYWSTLMVEPIADINPNDNSKGVQIQSIIRYAVQIITDYATQSLAPELKFENIAIEKVGNQRMLKVALANHGKIYYLTKLSLEIFDTTEAKKIEEDFSSPMMSLLPNTSKIFPVDITSLKKGTYKIVAFAKDDQENVFALEFELDVE